MSITINFNKLPELAAKWEAEVSAIVGKTTLDLEAHAKASMDKPGTGRTYKRKGGKGRSAYHRASAPGEAPAVDLGLLKNSIQSQHTGTTGTVSVGAKYGKALEYGTAKMKARPFLTPAAEKVKPGFVSALSQLEKLA